SCVHPLHLHSFPTRRSSDLPAAGILLAIGTSFAQDTFIEAVPFFGADWIQSILFVMAEAGGVVFDNLPLLFAVGVAIGLAGGDRSEEHTSELQLRENLVCRL